MFNNVINIKGNSVRFGPGIFNIHRSPKEFNPDGIPDELKAYNNWVIWAIVEKKEGEKPDKAPVYITDDGSYINLAQWGSENKHRRLSWDDALSLYVKWQRLGLIAGIGYVFDKEDPFVFIDIDKVSTGGVGAGALDVVNKFGTDRLWMETSVSGNGYHIIVKGRLDSRGINKGGIELYDNSRFCAMTGHIVDGSPVHDKIIDGSSLIYRLKEYIDELGDAADTRSTVKRERYGDGIWDGKKFLISNEVFEGLRDNTIYEFVQSMWYKYGLDELDRIVDDVNGTGKQAAIEESLMENMMKLKPPLADDNIIAKVEERWRIEINRFVEVEDKIYSGYIFVKSLNKWHDCNAGIVMGRQALDSEWAHKFSGVKGNPKISTKLERSGRMICTDSLTWFPSRWAGPGVRVAEDDKVLVLHGERLCNTWKGYGIDPCDAGAFDVYWSLLKHLFIEDKWCNVVLDWMAFAVQYPDIKCNWQLMVIGVPGAGKNALFSPFMAIWGRAGKCIGAKELDTDYEDGFCSSKAVLVSESSSLSSKNMDSLKCRAASESGGIGGTGPESVEWVDINPKGLPKVTMPNLWCMIFLSNNADALRLDEKERRFLVLNAVTEMSASLRDTYFAWLGSGGARILFRHLLDRDISSFDRSACEKTPWFWNCFDASRTDAESSFEDMVDINTFGDLVNPEHVCETLVRRGIKVRVVKVTLWLKNAGYESYPKGRAGEEDFKIQKRVDGNMKYKSRKWMYKKGSKYDYENIVLDKIKGVDIYDEVEKLEKTYANSIFGKF